MKGVGWGNAEPIPPPRTACVVDGEAVVRVLTGRRFSLTAEVATCNDIEAALVEAFGADQVSREHRLGPGERPDFLIGGRVVLEVKGPRHTSTNVRRQVERYAAHDCVAAIVVASASRILSLPRRLTDLRTGREVAVHAFDLGRAWL